LPSESIMLVLIFILAVLSQQTLAGNKTETKCFARNLVENKFDINKADEISCDDVGSDAKSLEEVFGLGLLEYQYGSNPVPDTRHKVEEVAAHIEKVTIRVTGNVKVSKNSLSKLTALKELRFRSSKPENSLEIEADALSGLSKLSLLWINGFTLSPSSIQALGSVADGLSDLSLSEVVPVAEIYKEVAKFSNLNKIGLTKLSAPVPESTFKSSAAKLSQIVVYFTLIPKITANSLKGLTNLSELLWHADNTTEIEAGAFDDLSNVKLIDLSKNGLKSLPDGLFNKVTNLEEIYLDDNPVAKSVTKATFANSKNFKNLRLEAPPTLGNDVGP